jgi:hypothetical protein
MCLKYALGLALTSSLAAFAQAQPTAARPPPPQHMQERLDLTPEQRKDLHVRIDWSSQQMQDIHRLGAIDGDMGLQFYRDYQKQYQEEFYQFLIPDPVNPWEMAGEPYHSLLAVAVPGGLTKPRPPRPEHGS